MASDVSICNQALAHVGAGTINALTEATAEARNCSLFYTTARDSLLAAYPWSWARKRESLAEVDNDLATKWQYAYTLPADCLRPIYVQDEDELGDEHEGYAYQVVGRTLYCDVSPAFLTYVYRLDDPAQYPAPFEEALAWSVASRIAMPLTKDARIRNDAIEMAARARVAAEVIDANGEQHRLDHGSEFITTRDA